MRDQTTAAPLVPCDQFRAMRSLYPFRHDSYFATWVWNRAVVAIVAGPDGDRQMLFCREKNAGAKSGTDSATGPTPRARSSDSMKPAIGAR
jgi:hypothetical protein